ncbi:FG-GAP repeat domain-containing protein [Streptomyces sp. NPDC007945]|uniref:FG-GAP repeat domain-containing protein n=1 Tax=Streptomyces sp. NPDC007945 TaxID=3364797 RepID=UPI0036E627D1
MPNRSTGRRLGASVAVVLATTLGAGALSAPSAGAADAPAPLRVESQSEAVAAGSTGFLLATNRYRGDQQFWVRYDTGKRTPVTDGMYEVVTENNLVGDTAVLFEVGVATVRNLTTGATLLTVPVEDGEHAAGLAGGAVFLTPWTSAGKLRMYDAEHGSRFVTGIPDGSRDIRVRQGTATHALLRYRGPDGVQHRGTVDLASAAVAEDHATPLADKWDFEAALSDTRIAWTEHDPATGKSTVVVQTRGTAEKQVVEAAERAQIAFLGDRLVHAAPDGTAALSPSPLNRLTVVDLKTGATTRLLDHVREITATPEGDLLVSGGKIGTGDGIFRVSAGADGTPAATFLAEGGYPAELAEVSAPRLPSGTADFDKTHGAPFTQYFNHMGVKYRYTLKHVRTGRTYTLVQNGYVGAGDEGYYPDGIPLGWGWDGTLNDGNASDPKGSMAAFNGAYTWETVAESGGGFGAPIKRSGTLTVTRAQKPHDFDDNGSPDILARDASGVLRTHDSGSIGGGWQIYDRVEATGNIAGSGFADIVARDKAGVLWLYQGNGRNGFAGRVKVGGGWQTYDLISGGSDYTGDGRPDLVAADRTGVLWMYRSTGSATKPFDTRKKIGSGWGAYNQLVGTGNIAGAAAGDLLARDKDGVLWMYLGKGDGTFTARTRIGGGFGRYSELIGSGDYDRDGKNDLLAVEPGTRTTYVFRGTGQRYTPLDLYRSATPLFKGGSYNLFS